MKVADRGQLLSQKSFGACSSSSAFSSDRTYTSVHILFNFHCPVSELVKLSDFCPIFAALYFWFMEELIQQTGARHVDADSHCSEELCKSVQIANDTLFKGGVQPEYVGCSLHHYAVCGVVRELHCASLCTALCNTARRPAADSAESCDAPFVNIHQQPPSSPMCTTLL